jgi:hypothetical protein
MDKYFDGLKIKIGLNIWLTKQQYVNYGGAEGQNHPGFPGSKLDAEVEGGWGTKMAVGETTATTKEAPEGRGGPRQRAAWWARKTVSFSRYLIKQSSKRWLVFLQCTQGSEELSLDLLPLR